MIITTLISKLSITLIKSKIFTITMGSGISSRRQEEKSRRMRQRFFVGLRQLSHTLFKVLRIMKHSRTGTTFEISS